MTNNPLDKNNPPKVAVFRLQLFKPSETFIAAQVNRYQFYQPFYLGRTLLGPKPSGLITCLSQPGFVNTIKLIAFRQTKPFTQTLKYHHPAIIHAHFAVDAVYALPVARKLGIPLVTTLHGFDVTTANKVFLSSKRPALINAVIFRRELQQHGDLFICVSEFIRDAAIKQGYPPNKTIVLPMGIDLDQFIPFQPTEPGLIVHVARLVEKKGTIYLLRAFAKLIKHLPHARLAIIGDGPLRSELQKEANQLGIENLVSFLGIQPHDSTKQWIAKADAVAVPSVTAKSGDCEGLPTICCEAAALGVPVVATRHSGIPEVVRDGKTGLLTEEADVPALAEALEQIVTDRIMRQSMASASRAFVETYFDMAKQTRQLETHYDNLLTQHT